MDVDAINGRRRQGEKDRERIHGASFVYGAAAGKGNA
jgi:hypothetical protein